MTAVCVAKLEAFYWLQSHLVILEGTCVFNIPVRCKCYQIASSLNWTILKTGTAHVHTYMQG